VTTSAIAEYHRTPVLTYCNTETVAKKQRHESSGPIALLPS